MWIRLQNEWINLEELPLVLMKLCGTINATYLKLFHTSIEEVIFHLSVYVAMRDEETHKENVSKLNQFGLGLGDFEIDG